MSQTLPQPQNSEPSPSPTPAPTTDQTPKLPFYDLCRVLSHQAGEQMLQEIPELAAVIVVPVWQVQMPTIYPGVLTSRQPQNRSTVERLMTIEQLTSAIRAETGALEQILQHYEQRAAAASQALRQSETTHGPTKS